MRSYVPMLSALILIVLSLLAVLGAIQFIRAVFVAKPRAEVVDFFATPDGDSWLEGEANRLRRQAERRRRSKSVDAPMKLLIARIIDDLMQIVAEEKERRRQATRLLELQRLYDDLTHSARQQLAATRPDEAIFQSYAQALADAEQQRHAVMDSLQALSQWRTDLERSARELIGAAHKTLARAGAGEAHTDFVAELTHLQRSAAELLREFRGNFI